MIGHTQSARANFSFCLAHNFVNACTYAPIPLSSGIVHRRLKRRILLQKQFNQRQPSMRLSVGAAQRHHSALNNVVFSEARIQRPTVVSDLIHSRITNYTFTVTLHRTLHSLFTVAVLTCVGYGPASIATASRTLPRPVTKAGNSAIVTIDVRSNDRRQLDAAILRRRINTEFHTTICHNPGTCQTLSSSSVSSSPVQRPAS